MTAWVVRLRLPRPGKHAEECAMNERMMNDASEDGAAGDDAPFRIADEGPLRTDLPVSIVVMMPLGHEHELRRRATTQEGRTLPTTCPCRSFPSFGGCP